ncbi:hypothetical protein [Shewanella psychromarinicola]|uniref:Uncharacterized protein n=1 Tax=Shewanella psychromarinicola TaxID=2487742 RepID=A0A3N4E5C6_9GAMM|nr:hypothetical protein [Shewanella psychromarinicola]AZG34811.1 hypothetical protein EGC80_07675 [Shewanella psychromarinicola]MCL1082971.1 hypothetical protein [Shewanella psychromarinicola]RPA33399.1 hypothetical protein EGC77_08690 [Shewanella psychromarinicola]
MDKMIDLVVESLLANRACSLDEDGLTEFMTSPNHLLARTVDGGRMLPEKCYPLYTIYHSYLTDEQRRKIYKSGYEIGHPDLIPCKKEEVFCNYLYTTYGGEDVEDLLRRIKSELSDLLGVDFKIYLERDRNIAYKVLCLFYRLCRLNRPQLFNFLKSGAKNGNFSTFEYRSAFPIFTEQGKENVALLAELHESLTFRMPKSRRWQLRSLITDFRLVGDQMAKLVKSEVEVFYSHEFINAEYHPENIPIALELIDRSLEGKGSLAEDSLDEALLVVLTCQELGARNNSNRLVYNQVLATPMNLVSWIGKTFSTFEDEDVLPVLLGDPSFKKKPELDIKADFIVKMLGYEMLGDSLLPSFNRQIIKALIVHDERYGVKISSKVVGDKGYPTAVTSILKRAVAIYLKSGSFPDWNEFPEALVQYWIYRYKYSLQLLLDGGGAESKESFCALVKYEHQVDDFLVNLLQSRGTVGAEQFEVVYFKFAYYLGYNLNKPEIGLSS